MIIQYAKGPQVDMTCDVDFSMSYSLCSYKYHRDTILYGAYENDLLCYEVKQL